MSFSTETKNELARVISGNECCNIAELSALVNQGEVYKSLDIRS
ncbi:putative sporulation transcription regulator whiA domain protein [Clostridioides difficile F314]|nr:hypothetical protein [Clostridioides difficile]EQH97641.1 putative sporulation transcription regulator whiA domain protein [Clostridioides difficile F314]